MQNFVQNLVQKFRAKPNLVIFDLVKPSDFGSGDAHPLNRRGGYPSVAGGAAPQLAGRACRIDAKCASDSALGKLQGPPGGGPSLGPLLACSPDAIFFALGFRAKFSCKIWCTNFVQFRKFRVIWCKNFVQNFVQKFGAKISCKNFVQNLVQKFGVKISCKKNWCKNFV